jgi:ankyrin repeat protein
MIDEFVGACHGDLATVQKVLVKHPELLNATARWAETPIQAASHAGARGVAEFLLSEGASLDITTAAMLGMLDRVRALLQQDPSLARAVGAHGLSVLYHAATTGQVEIAALLVTSGSDVNQGDGGNTALHAASRFKQLEMVRWLLDHGANVNASDYERKTPLHVAVESGHADVAELLRRRGGHE